jgi:hypothetical protein
VYIHFTINELTISFKLMTLEGARCLKNSLVSSGAYTEDQISFTCSDSYL